MTEAASGTGRPRPAADSRLLLLLLALGYGVHGFLSTLLPFLAGGLTEQEEWRVYAAAWVVVPLWAAGGAWLTVRMQNRCWGGDTGLSIFLLGLSGLFWAIVFGLFGLSASTFALHGAGAGLAIGAVLAYPVLLAGGGWLAHRHQRVLAACRSWREWVLPALPVLALVGAATFARGVYGRVHTVVLPWPIVDASIPAASRISDGMPVTRGAFILSVSNDQVVVEVRSRVDGVLREALPWTVFREAKAIAWLVGEGQPFAADQPLLTLASPQLDMVVRARAAGSLGPIALPPGSPVPGATPVCSVRAAGQAVGPLPSWSLAVLLGLVGLVLARVSRVRAPRPFRALADAAALVAMASLVIDPSWPVTGSHIHHYGFYLGPVNDLLHGKSLLVDISCQYGVLVVYALAATFATGLFPFTYPGFAALLAVLLVAQYALVYLLLRHCLRSLGLAVAALALIVAVASFSQLGLANLPSVGPLRFGLAYLVLGAAALRGRYPQYEQLSRGLAHALVGVASAWSLETFVYTLAAHAGVLIWEGAATGAGPRRLARTAARSVLPTLGAVLLVQLLLAAHILWRSGEWPHWSRYWGYVALYSIEGFGTFLVDPWSPWALYVAVLASSAVALACQVLWGTGTGSLSRYGVLAGMTTFGLAQLTYYLGRSHPNNLYHIALPAMFLAACWIEELGRAPSVPRRFAAAARFSACAAAAYLAIHCAPLAGAQWPRSALAGLLSRTSRWSLPAAAGPWAATRPEVAEAAGMVARYADRQRVPLFLEPDLTTEALVLSGRTHVFPLSHAPQEQLLEAARQRALAYAHGLRVGDHVFLSRDESLLNPIQRQLLERLRSEFAFAPVTSTENVLVVRLDVGPRPPPP